MIITGFLDLILYQLKVHKYKFYFIQDMSRFHREWRMIGGGPAVNEPFIPSGDQLPATHPANFGFFLEILFLLGQTLDNDLTHLL